MGRGTRGNWLRREAILRSVMRREAGEGKKDLHVITIFLISGPGNVHPVGRRFRRRQGAIYEEGHMLRLRDLDQFAREIRKLK